MKLDKATGSRKSVRRFTAKKPDWRDIIECVDAARYAPMAGAIYSPRFIIVDDKAKIQKIADAANQDFIAQAGYVVVVCSYSKLTLSSYGERGERYLRQQAGAAIQNFLLKVVDKELASCWVGAFADEQIKDLLNIPEDVNVEAVFPIGYEFGPSQIKSKIDIDRILYFNKYGEKKMKSPKRVGG